MTLGPVTSSTRRDCRLAAKPPALLKPALPSKLPRSSSSFPHTRHNTPSDIHPLHQHQAALFNSKIRNHRKPHPKPSQWHQRQHKRYFDSKLTCDFERICSDASFRPQPPLARPQPVRLQLRRRRLARRLPLHLARRRSATRPERRPTAPTFTRVSSLHHDRLFI